MLTSIKNSLLRPLLLAVACVISFVTHADGEQKYIGKVCLEGSYSYWWSKYPPQDSGFANYGYHGPASAWTLRLVMDVYARGDRFTLDGFYIDVASPHRAYWLSAEGKTIGERVHLTFDTSRQGYVDLSANTSHIWAPTVQNYSYDHRSLMGEQVVATLDQQLNGTIEAAFADNQYLRYDEEVGEVFISDGSMTRSGLGVDYAKGELKSVRCN